LIFMLQCHTAVLHQTAANCIKLHQTHWRHCVVEFAPSTRLRTAVSINSAGRASALHNWWHSAACSCAVTAAEVQGRADGQPSCGILDREGAGSCW
jgi:hypothetical protein